MTRAVIATEKGDIEIDLFTEGAPKAAANFVKLAKDGFYDDVIFHRVIPGFVIQGGDGQFGKKAIARHGPRRAPAARATSSTTSRSRATTSAAPSRWRTRARTPTARQFFIMHADYALPKNYTIFGQVTKGMDVVDAIAAAPRNSRDLPDEPVAMTSVTILDDA